MHYHCEIIMPPVDDVEKAVNEIMLPFNENADEEYRSSYTFFDWYVIGGRWSGEKIKAKLDSNKLDEFHQKLVEMKVTVSSVTAGKQELQPASQIPVVDALWRDMFPESGIDVCPLFKHYSDQYKTSELPGDACRLEEMPDSMSAERVIIAKERHDGKGLRAEFMISTNHWNGVNYVKSTWDGNVKSAIQMQLEKLEHYKDEYREKVTPKADWIVVTVDYHN